MGVGQYRPVLALPGLRSLLLVALLVRIPFTAAGITLTLHVVLELRRGYAAAGLVGTAMTVGAALGSPMIGRLIDRYGARPVLAATSAAAAAFWGSVPVLPYRGLVAVAFLAGLVAVPAFAVVRQAVAALTPEDRRRPAYALDAMAVEFAFMTGPAGAVLAATTLGPRWAVLLVGGGLVAGGLTLVVQNPPTHDRARDPADAAGTAPRHTAARSARDRLTRLVGWPGAVALSPGHPPAGRRLAATLAVSGGATFILIGIDLAIVAALRDAGDLGWASLVLVLWAGYSLVGGFCYGALPRAAPPALLLAGLGGFTVPVALVAGDPWWLLAGALALAGALVSPTLAATTDAVSRLAPGHTRGAAMGWHNAAMTTGLAVGAPVTGLVLDTGGPAWGFAAVGALGTAAAAVAAAAGWRPPGHSARPGTLLVPLRVAARARMRRLLAAPER